MLALVHALLPEKNCTTHIISMIMEADREHTAALATITLTKDTTETASYYIHDLTYDHLTSRIKIFYTSTNDC